MCGIAGTLNIDGRPCDPAELAAITDALAHRGPDGRGTFIDGELGLGHRRLSILDPSDAAAQPLSYLNGRYRITFNGEIYNFLELRAELRKLGAHFTSDSDTEVLVAAYHYWGADALLRANGMWAFAIWDAQRRELFLSRDRFGVKPLHYLADSNRFIFASELKSFRHIRGFTPRVNANELRRALSTGGESVEETLIEGVSQLPAGHNLLIGPTGMRKWRWWHTLDHLPDVPRRFPDQVATFQELFTDACRLRLRSDVPVATSLSGGMDSTSILCTVANLLNGSSERQARNASRAFVAHFEGTPYDETKYAMAAIERANAEMRLIPMADPPSIEDFRQYAFDFETIGVSLLTPPWLIYRAIRSDGVRVSLDGHGADELIGGYAGHLQDMLSANGSLVRAPRRTVSVALAIARQLNLGARGAARVMVDSDPTLRRLRVLLGDRNGRAQIASERNPADPWVTPWDGANDWLAIDDEARLAQLSPLNRMLYEQFHHNTLPSILRKYDRLSMAHGVESRAPFLDWRLVCFCFALPETSKIGFRSSKRVLRESMRNVLPPAILERKTKIGFQAPTATWLSGSLGNWLSNEVRSPSFRQSPHWDATAIQTFIDSRRHAGRWTARDAKRVWRYAQAHLWTQAYFGD
jgi:asparagine synthase (glutamine-hydrolysing)